MKRTGCLVSEVFARDLRDFAILHLGVFAHLHFVDGVDELQRRLGSHRRQVATEELALNLVVHQVMEVTEA